MKIGHLACEKSAVAAANDADAWDDCSMTYKTTRIWCLFYKPVDIISCKVEMCGRYITLNIVHRSDRSFEGHGLGLNYK